MSTAILMKKELMLGGLTCAHCAETIGEVVKNINGVQRSHMNFVSKKLILEIDSCYDEDEVIKEVIQLIDSIEPGLDIQVVTSKQKKVNKEDIILGGLTCAHCAEVIGDKVQSIDGVKNSHLNFVNKKLTLEIDSGINKDKVINSVIELIDSIEPGLDIQVQNKSESAKEIKKVEKKKDNSKKDLFKIIAGVLVFIFAFYQEATGIAVSYTHLTLPTTVPV